VVIAIANANMDGQAHRNKTPLLSSGAAYFRFIVIFLHSIRQMRSFDS
jgi:hypothetical protein